MDVRMMGGKDGDQQSAGVLVGDLGTEAAFQLELLAGREPEEVQWAF